MTTHVLPIQLDTRWLLVETALVREVLGAEAWLPIPRARPELPGVIVWRGRAVPLVDVARVLGLTSEGPQRARTLILAHDSGVAAVPIDAAREVRSVPDAELVAVHEQMLPYATRELDDEGNVMPLVDFVRLLADLHRVAAAEDDGR
jgi:chemotaxis signal transduction protein